MPTSSADRFGRFAEGRLYTCRGLEGSHAVEEFFARLKEHKLVQWLLGYAAVAVALIPVLDIVAAQFGWPESLRRGITLALIMGFFVVLVLAWYHGERGAQKMPRSEKLILVGLIVVSGVLLWRVAPRAQQAMAVDSSAANTVDAKAIAAKPPAKNSIAVMSFADLSVAQDQALFSEGMAEEILNALTRIKSLRVLGRSSSFQFQGKDIPPQTVGQQLGVAHVLTGSVRKQGNELRITVELVRTSDGVQQWSNQYDGRPGRCVQAAGRLRTRRGQRAGYHPQRCRCPTSGRQGDRQFAGLCEVHRGAGTGDETGG